MDDRTRQDKLTKALKRHGRPFVTSTPVERVTARSPFLKRLERLQKSAAAQRAPVVQLKRNAK